MLPTCDCNAISLKGLFEIPELYLTDSTWLLIPLNPKPNPSPVTVNCLYKCLWNIIQLKRGSGLPFKDALKFAPVQSWWSDPEAWSCTVTSELVLLQEGTFYSCTLLPWRQSDVWKLFIKTLRGCVENLLGSKCRVWANQSSFRSKIWSRKQLWRFSLDCPGLTADLISPGSCFCPAETCIKINR